MLLIVIIFPEFCALIIGNTASPFDPQEEVDAEYLFSVIKETVMHNVYRASDTTYKLNEAGYKKNIFLMFNEEGDTPLHAAAKFCFTKSGVPLFKSLAYTAATQGIDFSSKNHAGKTIEELLSRTRILQGTLESFKKIASISSTIYASTTMQSMLERFIGDLPKGLDLMLKEIMSNHIGPSGEDQNVRTMKIYQKHATGRDTWLHFSSWTLDDSAIKLYKALQEFDNNNRLTATRLVNAINAFEASRPGNFKQKEKVLVIEGIQSPASTTVLPALRN